jgi:hypothetical protein
VQKYLDWNYQPNEAGKKKKYPSQLYAILNKISKELLLLNIENSCQPRPPWTKKSEKLIDFAAETVERKSTAEKYQKFVNFLLRNLENIILYTNKSKNSKNAAAANCAFYGNQRIEKG